MASTSREREQRKSEQTPLEQHLLEHYQPILNIAQRLFRRFNNVIDHKQSILTRRQYEAILETSLTPAITYSELEAIIHACHEQGLLQLTKDTVHINQPLSLTPELSQGIIRSIIKQFDITDLTIDQVLDLNGNAQAKSAAAAAGLTNAYPADLKARRLLVFTVLALHDSERVPGISEGWNKLLIPGDLAYHNIATKDWDDPKQAEADGQLHIRGLANGGYLQVASPIRFGYRQRKFFFSVNRERGKQFRRSPAYQHWLEQHRPDEQSIEQVARQAYALARPCPAEFALAPDIRLIDQATLERLLAEAETGNLLKMVKLGYAAPAGNYNKEKDRFRRSDQLGKRWRHYFVGETLANLTDWKQSPDYARWLEEGNLQKLLLQEWQERLAPHCTITADFVPEEYQPAWLISEKVFQQTLQRMFPPIYLSAQGYVLMAGRNDYIYWPDPQHGLAYRRQDQRQQLSYTQRRTEGGRGVLAKMVESCFANVHWSPFPERLPKPTDWSNLRIIGRDQLEQLLSAAPELTISRLKRGGYLLDAQRSGTRSGVGYYIFCPDGPTQSAAVKASPWYATVQMAQQQHGHVNLQRHGHATNRPDSPN